MTKREIGFIEKLDPAQEYYAIPYRSLNHRDYYKIRTADGKPLFLATPGMFTRLSNRGVVGPAAEGKRPIDATLAHGMLAEYLAAEKAKAEKREARLKARTQKKRSAQPAGPF